MDARDLAGYMSQFGGGRYGSNPMSKFSDAISQLFRLDDLWREAEQKARTGDLIGWKWVLDSIWRELYADATRCKKKGRDWIYWSGNMKRVNQAIAEHEMNHAWARLYNALDEKHCILKDLQTEVGKSGQYKSEWEDDLS